MRSLRIDHFCSSAWRSDFALVLALGLVGLVSAHSCSSLIWPPHLAARWIRCCHIPYAWLAMRAGSPMARPVTQAVGRRAEY
ncbi:hypothetical protein BDW60DRAFT_193366 [Aspergillus nidulans var. acristatus]